MKNEQSWQQFFPDLQAYVESHGHLPDKNRIVNRALLSNAKYLKKKLKAGTTEDWMIERFSSILSLRSNEHTGGRRRIMSESLE